MFDYKQLFFVMQILLPMSCLAMGEQTVTITDLPQEMIQLIGQFAADNNVKDVFRLTMASKALWSAFSQKDLVKKLTLERLTKAVFCKQNSSVANHISGIDSFYITRKIKIFNGPPKPTGLFSESDVRITIQSVLNYSIYMGHHSLTRFLLGAGIPYDDESLLVAIAANNVHAVRLLLEKGATPYKLHERTDGGYCKFRPEDLAWRGIDNAPVENISAEEVTIHKEIYKLLQNAKRKIVFRAIVTEGAVLAAVVAIMGHVVLHFFYK